MFSRIIENKDRMSWGALPHNWDTMAGATERMREKAVGKGPSATWGSEPGK